MNISIAPLRTADLSAADHIFRLAFGTFIGMPNPHEFMGDADFVRSRWGTDATATRGAYVDGELIGSNFATNWGSFGFFGPLTVHPEYWNRGVAQTLLDATMPLFEEWGTRDAGLFTFPNSPKHLALYQRYGFWPRSLTAVMAKPVTVSPQDDGAIHFSKLDAPGADAAIAGCLAVTDSIQPGLDVHREIEAARKFDLGDTIMVDDDVGIAGLAVCHSGAGSEAGRGNVYIKFGAVRSGANGAMRFARLMAACEAFAAQRDATRLIVGINTARHNAYRELLDRGFRTFLQGVAMHRPNVPAFNREDCYVVDDWR